MTPKSPSSFPSPFTAWLRGVPRLPAMGLPIVPLLSVTVLLAGALIAVLVWTTDQAGKEALRAAERVAQYQAELLGQYADFYLSRVDDILSDLTAEAEAAGDGVDTPGFRSLLARHRASLPELMEIQIFGATGLLLTSSQPPPLSGAGGNGTNTSERVNAGAEEFFRAHRDRWTPLLLSPPVRLGRTTQWAIGVSRSIESRDGRFQGVARILIRPDFLWSYSVFSGSMKGNEVALFREDGRLFSAWPCLDCGPSEVLNGRIGDLGRFHALAVSGFTSQGMRSYDDGRSVIGVFQLADHPLRLAIALERGEILRPWAAQVRNIALVILGIIATVGAFFSIAILQTKRRRAAELALRRSEHSFRAVAESAQDAIVSAGQSGIIAYCNPKACAMFGYSAAELAGQPVAMLMPERFRDAHSQALQRLQDSFKAGTGLRVDRFVELVGCRRDGSEFPIEISLGEWRAEGHRQLTAVIRDISRRRRLELALADAERRLAMRSGAPEPAPLAPPAVPPTDIEPTPSAPSPTLVLPESKRTA